MPIKLFLCGDVMTGRGIDQILPHPCSPELHEAYVKDARDYVRLAEEGYGPIPRHVSWEYIWGDALAEFDRARADARIINLETSVTLSDQWVEKGINYRMHPENSGCLRAAGINCCALANNHVLDWDLSGMTETLETLARAQIRFAGAGLTLAEASAPAMLPIPGKGRVLVFSLGFETSGIPPEWAATAQEGGVWLIEDLSLQSVRKIGDRIRQAKSPGDVAIASIHWGPNWGHEISDREIAFAHALIEEAQVDLIHGHSSHHPKAFEVYRDKLILYGCGDFIDDYEGICGYEKFRGDLGLMYFAEVQPEDGRLVGLEMVATQLRGFQVKRANHRDAVWLAGVLRREGARFGSRLEILDGRFRAVWEMQRDR